MGFMFDDKQAGFLCAYRWNGEQTLDPAQFAHVAAML